jgi:hypothetical protein
MGGGFLFWTENNVYRADTFDGVLRPIARTTDGIQNMSFAPKFALVRTKNGERWALGVPTGERAAVEPLGVSDVEGLDDGRALAFNDSGAAFSSLDSGAHWTDVTAQLHSSPTRVAMIDDELWLYEASGGALRLEPDGRLAAFDKQPPEPQPELRPHDPRWRGTEAPLRTALHVGASVDDSTAIGDRRRAGRHRARRRAHRRDHRHRLRQAPAGRALRSGAHRERRALRLRDEGVAAVGAQRLRRLAHAVR